MIGPCRHEKCRTSVRYRFYRINVLAIAHQLLITRIKFHLLSHCCCMPLLFEPQRIFERLKYFACIISENFFRFLPPTVRVHVRLEYIKEHFLRETHQFSDSSQAGNTAFKPSANPQSSPSGSVSNCAKFFSFPQSSDQLKIIEKYIDTKYDYHTTIVEKSNGKLLVSIDFPIFSPIDVI
jgi:hypothetical protein